MPTSLWRDRNSRLHVLGTMHALPGSAHPLPSQMTEAFEQSERIVLEARPDREKDLNLGSLPGGMTLREALDRELWERTRAAVLELGADFESRQGLRPWAVVVDLSLLRIQEVRARSDLGIEAHYLALSLASGKHVDELEDIDYIPRRLNQNRLAGIEFLRQFLHEPESRKATFRALLEAYIGGDLVRLKSIREKDFGPYPSLTKVLLTQRNRNWLPKVNGYRRSPSQTLVSVGIMHLVGEENLLQLLEQKGARFEQL